MQHPDVFAVVEGQARPTEESNQAEEETAQLVSLGLLYTPGGTRMHLQAACGQANQDLYAIPYLDKDKAAAPLLAIRTCKRAREAWQRAGAGKQKKTTAHERNHLRRAGSLVSDIYEARGRCQQKLTWRTTTSLQSTGRGQGT